MVRVLLAAGADLHATEAGEYQDKLIPRLKATRSKFVFAQLCPYRREDKEGGINALCQMPNHRTP